MPMHPPLAEHPESRSIETLALGAVMRSYPSLISPTDSNRGPLPANPSRGLDQPLATPQLSQIGLLAYDPESVVSWCGYLGTEQRSQAQGTYNGICVVGHPPRRPTLRGMRLLDGGQRTRSARNLPQSELQLLCYDIRKTLAASHATPAS